ncbi:MAG: hypothetical protein COV69_02215 [Parcubacteria group bacterium CG11_big_fil_rev_8_21_14_0_20_39_14]|nr:MAG: hypothetical protein COV69_02215 [Parcubacteria group bacterium CG11_big_fil_rev_8_21_14_0_20_39_14]PIS35305.1 MAG: hypothetical protein COT36_03055 [Parcubacteria group bacterium CG08_land_8_20_14_0_20_38_56]
MFYKKTEFGNGLRLITVPLKDIKTAAILILVKTGSVYEKKRENGISHVLEHMLFKGTKKRPHTINIARELDSVGAKFNAFTGKEFMGFYTMVNSRHLDIGLDVLSDIFLNSKLEKIELEREKKVIIEEIKMYYDTPMRHIEDLWENLLYGDQPAGWDIAGTKENVQKMNQESLKGYYSSQFVASSTVIVLAGKFEKTGVPKKIGDSFSKMKIGLPRKIPKTQEKQNKPQYLLEHRKTDQTHLILGTRAYNVFHPDKYALSILAAILGGNMSSRLFTSIRERRGLAYYVHTLGGSHSDRGYLATSAGVEHQKLEKTVKLILKEYKRIIDDVTEDELNRAKEFLKGRFLIELEGPDDYGFFVGGEEITIGEILTPEEKCAKIDKVMLGDLKRVAKDIFRAEKLNLAVIGPHKNKNKFQKLLGF